MQIRRHRGGSVYFFTAVTADRRPLLVEHIDRLRYAFKTTIARYPFAVEAIVVVPDHLHTIWSLPEGDLDYSRRWRILKRLFSSGLPLQPRSASQYGRRESGVWQRRFWERCIQNQRDLRKHMDYLHYNPVKHGLCSRPSEWPFSSFARMVAAGIYGPEWGRDYPSTALAECGDVE